MLKSLRETFYADKTTVFDAGYWNAFVAEVEARFSGLDGIKIAWADVQQLGVDLALERINEALGPAADRLQRISELGFLIAPSETLATLEAAAIINFTISEGDQRALFTPSPFVAVTRQLTPDDYAVARARYYDAETGQLELEILSVFGDPGPHDDWQIAALAGSVMAQLQMLEEGIAARDAAEAAKTAAQAASTTATAQAVIATARAGEAATSKAGAETGAATATAQAAIATTKATEAATSKTGADTAKTAAQAAQTAAEGARDTATAQAAIATTKAGEAATSKTGADAAAATATAQAAIATTKAGEAATSKTDADTAAATATAQAAIATTKAGEAATSKTGADTAAATATAQAAIATTKAGQASVSAASALSDATTATAQAGIATTKAGEAAISKTGADTAKTGADAAAATATAQATIATTKAGEAATSKTGADTAKTGADAAAATATAQAAIATTKAGEASASATVAATYAGGARTVRAASTANVNIASAPATLDGVALANGDRILLKDQTTASQNGLWVFTAAGAALARATDANTAAGLPPGLQVSVSEGTLNAGSSWRLATAGPIVVDTTGLTFSSEAATLFVQNTAVAATATCDIGAANTMRVLVSGSGTTITSFGTRPACFRLVRFGAGVTLTHSAALALPTAANILTTLDDTCIALSDNSGNWRIFAYIRGTGKSVGRPALADNTDYEIGTWTPGFSFATPGDVAGTVDSFTANYIKVGSVVHLWFTMAFTPTFTTASGNFLITGAPFTILSTTANGGVARNTNIPWVWPAGKTSLSLNVPGSTTLGVSAGGTGVAASSFATSNLTSGQQHTLTGAITYKTS